MNSTRKMEELWRNMSLSPLEPHTMIAIRETAINLVRYCANTALICKSLSCCTRYTPQHLPYIGPVVIGVFIYIIYTVYSQGRKIFEAWNAEKDRMVKVNKLGFLVKKAKKAKVLTKKGAQKIKKKNQQAESVDDDVASGNGGKWKRKNHRGGVKAKKAKGKGEGGELRNTKDF
ncbi:hypothetical protein EYC80_003553 [Monilinia laxa]|uniref:Uncharacterized protein n=1 Tax=Monilinia laxa TaxID=61186 RepID=A0A5N6KK19_MONLA|nr:hypothetical protein EYC80_003553 [Monilinia laxa]